MNISEAKAFLAVVSARSISKAAETLYLTQSTVSCRLRALEEELGVILFERGKGQRETELTTKGSEFVSIAQRFVQVWNEAQGLRYMNTLNLTISSVDSVNIFTLAPLYRGLISGDPPMRLKIFTHQTPEIFEQVESRLADVGFALSLRRYPNVIARAVFREPQLFVRQKRAGEKDAPPSSIHPRQFDFSREILFNWGPEFFQWRSAWCNPHILPPLQVDTVNMLMQFLSEDYWTILPVSLTEKLKEKNRLTACPIEEGPPDRICYYLVHRFPRPVQQAGIKLFEERLAACAKNPLFVELQA